MFIFCDFQSSYPSVQASVQDQEPVANAFHPIQHQPRKMNSEEKVGTAFLKIVESNLQPDVYSKEGIE